MKKTMLLFFILLLYGHYLFSQNTSTFLTWMKGDNTINQPGIYGTQGTAAATNKPGARNFSATWKDSNDNLWLFGGLGLDGSATGYLNDLWKYNPSSNEWTWVKGENTVEHFSVYGTQGIANTANKPGGIFSGVSWTDAGGNLWLFGGFGYTENDFGFLNDLWKYNPSSNKWTWIKGDKAVNSTAAYGTQGIANTVNHPGARYGSRAWTDSNGNLWLFSGYGLDSSGTQGILNDLWKYNPVSNQWTWMKGDTRVDQPGVYGVKGTANISNKPGARYVSTSWTDSNDKFWIFGGDGFNGSTQGILNDLWKYDPSTNKWTWISGDSSVNKPGIYGVQGKADAANKPGARYVSVSWKDASGNLWLFGGYGYDTNNEGYLNDLWKYNPAANKWTWVKGDNRIDQLGVYGSQGIPSVYNKSGSRNSCVSWTSESGDLWLFGGYGFSVSTSGMLNDLWKISTYPVLPLQLLNFSGVLNNDVIRLQWETTRELNFSRFAVQRSFDGSNFAVIGNVNSSGFMNESDYSYYDNDLHNRPEQKVFYRLQLIDNDGHFTYSNVIMFSRTKTVTKLEFFPNPTEHFLNLSFDQKNAGIVMINITDMTGLTVFKQKMNLDPGRTSMVVDVSGLSAATYIISLTNTTGTTYQKFIKQ